VVKADLDPVLDAQRKEEAALIGRWSSTTQPEKSHVWKIEQYMDYLDDDSAQPPAAPHPSPPKHAQACACFGCIRWSMHKPDASDASGC